MRRRRSDARGITALELAIALSLLGCALAATVPACVHAIHTARTAEAVDEVDRILRASMQRLDDDPKTPLASAPLTPSIVPRGAPVSDPPGTWEQPAWKAIGFSLDAPHWYAYELDVDPDASTTLRAIAHGDLDGDGVLSTFQREATREGTKLVARPGLVVTHDLE